MTDARGLTEPTVIASIDEGLDFACSLISSALDMKVAAGPEAASELLRRLTQYIQFRYVGEYLLALEYLSDLGRLCEGLSFRHEQFWQQLVLVAELMSLSDEQLKSLQLPSA